MYILRKVHDKVIWIRSEEFNIDNGSGTTEDDVLAVPSVPYKILSARVVYQEATDTAGAEGATVSIGTTAGGVDIVAAVALTAAQAVGAKQALTILTAEEHQVADQAIFIRHTGIASTEAGKYRVQLEIALM